MNHIKLKFEEIVNNKQVENVESEIIDEDEDNDIDDETPKVSKRTERVLRAFQSMIPILTVAAYLVLGAVFKMWHPAWIVFITIPLFYMFAGMIDKEEDDQ